MIWVPLYFGPTDIFGAIFEMMMDEARARLRARAEFFFVRPSDRRQGRMQPAGFLASARGARASEIFWTPDSAARWTTKFGI